MEAGILTEEDAAEEEVEGEGAREEGEKEEVDMGQVEEEKEEEAGWEGGTKAWTTREDVATAFRRKGVE